MNTTVFEQTEPGFPSDARRYGPGKTVCRAERPIAQLVRSLREQPREEVVRQVQDRYVAPARLVEELSQQAQ